MKWPTLKIQRFCKTGSGGTPSTREKDVYYGGDIPWVKSGELKDNMLLSTEEALTNLGFAESAAKWVPAGSVLVAMYGATIGKTALLGIDATTNQAICNVIPNPQVADNRFVWYALRHTVPQFLAKRVGGAQPNISQKIIGQTSLPIPPISEQLRIVEILDQADALRKKRAEADSKAAHILPALFYKMFGDPATNPKGWDTGSLGDVILETQYGTSTKANTSGDGLPVLRMNNIDSDGYLDLTDLKYVMLSAKENEKYALTDGDILFNRTNSKELVGKTGLWLGEMEVVAASYLIRVRVDQERAIPEFIWAYMNCPFIKQMLLNRCRRAIGMANINAKELRNLPLILPKRDRQVAFAEHFDGLEQLRSQRKQNAKAIDRLFDTLLYRAFTSDLTAQWREAHMKELLAEMEQQAKVLECRPNKSKQEIRLTSKTSHIALSKATLTGSVGKDFLNFRPAYLKIQEDMERLTRMVKPSYLSVYEQMERFLEPIRRQHLEMTRSIEFSELASSRLTEIVQANQRWHDLIVQATTSTRAIEDFSRIHQTWLDKINPMQDSIAQLQAAAKMFLGDVAYRMTVTERIFAGIDFKAMRRAVALPESAFLRLENVIGDVTLTYEKLAASIRTIPDMTHLPMFILPGATREVFMAGYALDAICIPDKPDREKDASEVQLITEVEQETSGCIGLLEEVDPALARPYIGAHDALRGRNADRTRHILSSLREFWNHLLRRLAPDERVWPWVDSQGSRERLCKKGELLFAKDGKENLTRGSRVLFVCRNLNHPPLTDFVVQDTHALVKLVKFFNRVHELEPELTDEQLRALLLRTDSWLTYILQIWKGTR